MARVHFLNVKNGDCNIIEHDSGNVTVIDICNARSEKRLDESFTQFSALVSKESIRGSYNQKKYPVNPINYMKNRNIRSIFRFILTHPDMDHLDGIKDLFDEFDVTNFWDTEHDKKIDNFDGSPFREDDWLFYQDIREKKPIKVLNLYNDSKGKYYNRDDDGKLGDGLFILSPYEEFFKEDIVNYNDISYVILLINNDKKILFAGDSHNKAWKKIVDEPSSLIRDIDVLVAPHHGRNSNRDFSFLKTLKPKLTLIGNAKSSSLAYTKYKNNGKTFTITNNQANCVILDINSKINVFVTNEKFAQNFEGYKFNSKLNAYYIGDV